MTITFSKLLPFLNILPAAFADYWMSISTSLTIVLALRRLDLETQCLMAAPPSIATSAWVLLLQNTTEILKFMSMKLPTAVKLKECVTR